MRDSHMAQSRGRYLQIAWNCPNLLPIFLKLRNVPAVHVSFSLAYLYRIVVQGQPQSATGWKRREARVTVMHQPSNIALDRVTLFNKLVRFTIFVLQGRLSSKAIKRLFAQSMPYPLLLQIAAPPFSSSHPLYRGSDSDLSRQSLGPSR